MADDDRRPKPRDSDRPAPGEPRVNWLRRIIGQGPEARQRLGEAVGSLLGTALVALAAFAGLVIWHLIRRGRIIRERLEPPKIVRLPAPEDLTGGHLDDPNRDDDLPPA